MWKKYFFFCHQKKDTVIFTHADVHVWESFIAVKTIVTNGWPSTEFKLPVSWTQGSDLQLWFEQSPSEQQGPGVLSLIQRSEADISSVASVTMAWLNPKPRLAACRYLRGSLLSNAPGDSSCAGGPRCSLPRGVSGPTIHPFPLWYLKLESSNSWNSCLCCGIWFAGFISEYNKYICGENSSLYIFVSDFGMCQERRDWESPLWMNWRIEISSFLGSLSSQLYRHF